MLIRYIRDWQNGKTVNGQQGSNCDWREIQVIDYNGNNLAPIGTLTCSHEMNQPLTNIVDNNFTTLTWSNVNAGVRKNICIDLGGVYNINKIIVARAASPGICKETKLEVSVDNVKWVTVFDSVDSGTYQETDNGKEFILPNDNLTSESTISEIMERVNCAYRKFESCKLNLKNNLIKHNIKTTDKDSLPILIGKVNDITIYKLPAWFKNNDIWMTAKDMPTGRYQLASSVVDDKIYVVGGSDKLKTNECFNTTTGEWNTKAEMPTGRHYLAAETVNGTIYAMGGSFSTANQCYDPKTDTWNTKTNLLKGKQSMGSCVIDTDIYLLGGSAGGSLKDNDCYDTITNTWSKKALMDDFYGYLGTEAVDGKIYIFINSSTKTMCYDPKTDTYTNKANKTTIADFSTCVLNEKIYLMGGTNGSAQNRYYDPKTDKWVVKSNLPTGRRRSTASVVDGVAYVIGGDTSNVGLTKNECYIP